MEGYQVFGTSRDVHLNTFSHLKALGIKDKVSLESMSLTDFRSVYQVVMKAKPEEIYNLAGQSSVGISFEQPVETLESISLGTLTLLEVIRLVNTSIKFYNACSSECFGNTGIEKANELTSFQPRSPYAVAKCAAYWEVANYREAYNLFACSGILFNHESPLRHERFVTQKIISAVCRIAQGSTEKLILGNIDVQRDWGWAPEYINAMFLMMRQSTPEDYVIATGTSNSLRDFVKIAFDTFGLDWTEYTITDVRLLRPSDIMIGVGDPSKAFRKLGWKAVKKMPEIIEAMIQAQLTKANIDLKLMR